MPVRRADPLLRLVARRIKQRREGLGWTQEILAENLGIATKNLQRLEAGGENPTLQRLQRIAEVIGIPLAELVDPTDDGTAATEPLTPRRRPLRLAALELLGWRIERGREDGGPEPRALPVFDLRAAAGPRGSDRPARTVAWARPPPDRRLRSEGLFLARVVGDSMAPRIPDGAWCLFRAPVETPLLGKIVLVHYPDPTEIESAGAWQLKRIGALEQPVDGGLRVRLESLNPAVPPQVVTVADERELVALGELVEVLARAPHYRGRDPA